MPMIIPVFMFVFPLCQAFSQGIAAGHEQIRAASSGSPRKASRKRAWRRAMRWLGLWIGFFIVVEVYAHLVVGGGGGFFSALNAGVVLGMVAVCFFWVPRCQKLWTLWAMRASMVGAMLASRQPARRLFGSALLVDRTDCPGVTLRVRTVGRRHWSNCHGEYRSLVVRAVGETPCRIG